jgi:VWFA-related protein
MVSRARLGVALGFGSLLLSSLGPNAPAHGQTQTPPRFRAGVTLVPVDVRVVDKDGKPIVDLKASDFAVYEDGVKQEIAHFQMQGAEGAQDTGGRAFAIVLGRGRLNQPGRALDALIEFVRSRMLPNDRLGVLAYFRATELTTDHEAVARWLERYRDRHESIESRLARDNARVFGPELSLSADTGSGIDSLFDGPVALPYHLLPAGADGTPVAFADSRYLVRAIQYLSQVDGEKQLIFLSERGLPIGRNAIDKPADGYYARLASTARVALSLIYTGGVRQPTSLSRGRVVIPRSLPLNPSVRMGSDYRLVAEQTGGLASLFEDINKPLAQLDRMTRLQYLLGYYPASSVVDGGYRRIHVVVNRAGATVLHRQTYQLKTSLDDVTLERVFTEARVEQALAWLDNPSVLSSITSGMKLSVGTAPSLDGERRVRIDVSFDPLRTRFVKSGDFFVAAPDLVVVVDDSRRRTLTRVSERLDIRLTEREYTRLKNEWLSHVVTIRVKGDPAQVRAVVYDYDTDHVLYGAANLTAK